MHDTYLRDLQKETFSVFVVLAAIIAVLQLGVVAVIWRQAMLTEFSLWLPSAFVLLACFLGYRFNKVDRFRRATYIFVGGLTLAVISFILWPETQFVTKQIYLLLLVVAMAGVLISPRATIVVAAFATTVTVLVAFILYGLSWDTLQLLIVPLGMTGTMALISWISAANLLRALEWAIYSEKAALDRSGEILERQQELEKAYAVQESTNVQLKEAEVTAKKASDLKTRFISNLSHEMRTPLTAIINFSYILSQMDADITEEQQKDYLNRIYEAGEFLRDISNDLLDLAKIEAGQMELFLETVDLIEIGASAVNTTSVLVEDKPVKMHFIHPANLNKIQADKVRIQQILLNLLGNASKYTEAGDITLQLSQNNGTLQVSVVDTGIGIKEEDFDRIFEEFQQADEAFTLRKPGAGLGLPISRKFVELHGGKLWVESKVGEGSTFYFTLPPHPPSAANDQTPVDPITKNEAAES
jgi:signal transduction histidine kinase